MTLGGVIRDARKKRGWTQEQVEQMLQVSSGAISQYESGTITPALPIIIRLAKLFDVTIDALLAEVAADGIAVEAALPASASMEVDPLLLAAWQRMNRKSRKLLVQFAMTMAGEDAK